jgi:hypothetical protein
MDGIKEFLSNLFRTDNWPPRWLCGTWTEFHGWLYILSDLAIWGAYFSIPVAMLWFILKRKEDIPFVKVFWLFVIFIMACGTTHLMDAILFWYPAYRLSGLILFLTAIISWTAVISLIGVLPEAVRLRSPKQYEKIIDDRTRELTASNLNLTKLNRDIDNFVYAASHDLKSPLNNFEGLLELLRQTSTKDQDTIEILDKMDYSISKMKKTIGGMSEVIRIEKSPLDDVEDNNIRELVAEVARENESLFRESGVEFTYSLETETIRYSRVGLKSILYNLLTNAIKYRSTIYKPVVKISAFNSDQQLCLQVTDNGIGIDLKKYGHKLFGLFKRFHDHVEGSGLGLFMVKRMVEDRGGKIEVQSEPNKGSTFTIIFQ